MSFKLFKVLCYKKKKISFPISLIEEKPLSIKVQRETCLVVMRTPGNDKEHAAGFCLSEGIVNNINEISSITFCDGYYNSVIIVILVKSKRKKLVNKFENMGYISNTGCGLCGKKVTDKFKNFLEPIKDNSIININRIMKCLSRLEKYQILRKKTRTTHCSVIYDKNSKLLSAAEDIGRHNALDKSIGFLFLKGILYRAKIIALSSRISYELVQKAVRANIPILSAMSRPTSLAVILASKLNLTIVSLSPNRDVMVYCNSHRLLY